VHIDLLDHFKMMHDRFNHKPVFQHQNGAQQIIRSIAETLENPQVRGIPITRLARVNDIQQQKFVDSTLSHSHLGMLGNDDSALKSRAIHIRHWTL